MRDDANRWTPALGPEQHPVQTGALRLEVYRPHRLTLISGPVVSGPHGTSPGALALAGFSEAIGWPDPASGESHALRVRRDRILVVNGPALAEGWHADSGLAVSEMTDGYLACTLTGSGAGSGAGLEALDVLRRGTDIDPAHPSRSVVRTFSGYAVMIHAMAEADSYRLYVARGYFDGFWDLLRAYCREVAG